MSEQDNGVDPEAVFSLSSKIVALAKESDVTFSTLLTALAEVVVAFEMEVVHLNTKELKHEDVARQLAIFYAYSVDVAAKRVEMVNEQLTSQRMLESYADVMRRHTGEE